MPDQRILELEKALSLGHRALLRAYVRAQDLDLYGLADDLWGMAHELGGQLEDFLKNAPHQKVSRF